MATSSLSENLRSLRTKIAVERGYSRHWDTTTNGGTTTYGLDDDQKAEVEEILTSGLRNFYWPESGHIWSFMRPVGSVTTIADTWQYTMPGDFGGIEGDITYSTSSTAYCSIKVVSEPDIRDFRQHNPTMSGQPRYAAVRMLASDGTTGQKFQLVFYPTPDDAYTLEFTQVVNPNIITEANPFPYGGPAHSETIIESCLAVAESRKDGNLGVHSALFEKHLAKSMELDAKLVRPQSLGINRDHSDRRHILKDRSQVRVTYQGVQY